MNKSLRDFKNSKQRRSFLEENVDAKLMELANHSFSEEAVHGRNIENLIGGIDVPLGVAGPILVNSSKYYLPLATTEGALVASVSRGAKAVTLSGGANAFSEFIGITRGPVFRVEGLKHGLEVKEWVIQNFDLVKDVARKTSNHLELTKADFDLVGKDLFMRFYFDTKDAMGMNMATVATGAVSMLIEQKTAAKCLSVAGNYDLDKKPGWINFIKGRGRKVWAETIFPKEVITDILKTTPAELKKLIESKCHIGSALSGSLGFNAHFANIIAAIFLATGQDVAQVVEGSLGITNGELLENGDLYFSVYLPSLLIGTVGGGTRLPSQQSSFKILKFKQKDKTDEFAKVIASAVLAGEISLLASQAAGSLVTAHQELGRNLRVEAR